MNNMEEVKKLAGKFSVFGLPAWQTTIAAEISLAQKRRDSEGSSPIVISQCLELLSDDSGGVGIIENLLAEEVLFLNSKKYDLSLTPQLDMNFFFEQFQTQYAEKEEVKKLKEAMLSYFQNHECAEDRKFQDWISQLQSM